MTRPGTAPRSRRAARSGKAPRSAKAPESGKGTAPGKGTTPDKGSWTERPARSKPGEAGTGAAKDVRSVPDGADDGPDRAAGDT